MNWRRWWAEFRDPALKCARTGHAMKSRRYTGIESAGPLDFRCVAFEVVGRLNWCARCGGNSDRIVDMRDGLQGLQLPTLLMKRLERDGFIEI